MNFASITVDQIQIFLLVFVRVATIVTMLPIFGSAYLPAQTRAGFSLILALILFPLLSAHGPLAPPSSWGLFAVLVAKEVLVGLLMGFVASLMFAAVQLAGTLIDYEMGFGFVQLVDPLTESEVTVTGQLQVLVFTIFFLLINGHYFMLIAVQKSLEVVPLMGVHFQGAKIADLFTTLTGGIFAAGVVFAAPVYVALFLSSLGMALVARTVPQMNIFFVGLPLKIVLGLVTLAVAFPILGDVFAGMTGQLIRDMYRVLYLLA